jgi:hypothetical protein
MVTDPTDMMALRRRQLLQGYRLAITAHSFAGTD